MNKNNNPPLSQELKRVKPFFDMAKRTTDAYLFCMDLETKVALVSPNFVQDFDLPGEVLSGFQHLWAGFVHPEERGPFISSVKEIIEEGSLADHVMEYRVKNKRGEYIWLKARATTGLKKLQPPKIFLGTLTPMAGRNHADEVTGLLNKYQFERSVKTFLAEHQANGAGGAVMVLGLDNFKIVNETVSRLMGDQVLKQTARLIEDALPEGLTLYKLDGDMFAILYPRATEEDVTNLYGALQRTLSIPRCVQSRTYFCTISGGTVFCPDGGKDYLVLYKHAEAAMDIAKQRGKNQNYIFSKEAYNRWIRAISMRDSLRESAEMGFAQFRLFFQPQVSVKNRRLLGAEALLRWINPKGRMVSPMEFIPILEETKLIIPVGRWIIEEALRICSKWRRILPDFTVSINLSYDQVKESGLRDFVFDALNRWDLPPQALILELTESKIIADWDFINREFDAFRKRGVAIAMDDFGTGYSSLSTLKNLSCDIIKIDREFAKDIVSQDFDFRLVKYTVDLCHSIGMTVVVEGVEEEDAYRLLADECGADIIQGYLFGHPEPVEEFEKKFLALPGENIAAASAGVLWSKVPQN